MENKKYKGLRALLIVLLVFVVVFITGFVMLSNYDGYNEGGFYAWLFVSGFVVISCIALIPMFIKRRRSFNSALDPKTQFCQWQLDVELVEKTAKEKFKNARQRNKSILIVIGIFWVIFSIIFAIFIDEDSRLIFIVLMVAIFTVVAMFAVFAPIVSYRRSYTKAREVYLGENAVIIGKEFHVFDSLLSRYASSKYNEKSRLLIIDYEAMNRTGWVSYSAQVPVPAGYEQKAFEYIALLKKIHK